MTDETGAAAPSTLSKIETGAAQVGATVATDAKAGVTWLSLHPDVMKILAGLAVGVALGYLFFH